MNELMRELLFLPEQASTVAHGIDVLHYVVITTTMVGAFAVAAALLYFLLRYRDRPHGSRAPDERKFHTRGGIPLVVELGVFGGLLTMFIVWWIVGFRQYIEIAEPPPDALPIYVTGKQWMWSFAYPNGGGSEGVLYVPANRPVKLIMTSRDVIHSFYVPAFRLKRDVVPGLSTTMWFEAKHPGRYNVFCAEYCGTNHSRMRAEVVVVEPSEFQHAIDRLIPEGGTSLAKVGERVAAERGCLRCHTLDGTPHIGPTWAGLYGARIPLATGGEVIADEAYLTRSMMDPTAQIHRSFLPVMPTYQGLLSAGDVGALVELIRSLRDRPRVKIDEPLPNGTAPLVTPLPGASP